MRTTTYRQRVCNFGADQQGEVPNSFTLDFTVSNCRDPLARGRTVYVVTATDGTGKRPVPLLPDAALGSPA